MGTRLEDNGDFKYMIVDPEKGGILDLLRFTVWGDQVSGVKFLETSPPELAWTVASKERWMITVSIVARKILARVAKPIRWTGSRVEFLLNLLSQNGNLLGLLCNEKVVVPCSESENFLSTVAHLDGRIDLYKTQNPFDPDWSWERAVMGSRALMDLCIMASKLAYENANVVKKVVHENWKMHFEAFYNGWNDFQQRWSTPVFILCDKPTDANLILISFRGTELFDPDDWITDFDCVWFEIPGVGKVHAGFVEALGLANRIHPATFAHHLQVKKPLSSPDLRRQRMPLADKSAYYAVGKKLKSLLEQHKDAKFIVTGHSLGGALAILLPTLMLLSEEKEMMQRLLGVYTFGQPRIGNMQLERFMETHMKHPVPKYIRVVYCNDLVPRLPLDDKLFSYKHFGNCLYYDNLYIRREPVEVPNRNFFGMAYLIPKYVNAWWELIRSFFMGYSYGPHYQEGWFSILLRIGGLILPGVSAHSPRDYVNSVRLGNPYW